jgi:hypothetical protein
MFGQRGRRRLVRVIVPITTTTADTAARTIIYVLCASEKLRLQHRHVWERYPWARLVVMKYQDVTFENAFWKQLQEIHDEWKDCGMVGTIACTAYKKIDICQVDREIAWVTRLGLEYHHFRDTKVPIERTPCTHPNFKKIYSDIRTKLGLGSSTTCAYCNYFMCKPEHMCRFIDWYHEHLRPAVVSHPLSMTDALYKNPTLGQQQLLRLCGTPYYPHVPFVIERMNKCFFDTFIHRKQPLANLVLVKRRENHRPGPLPNGRMFRRALPLPAGSAQPRSANPTSIMFRRAIQAPGD